MTKTNVYLLVPTYAGVTGTVQAAFDFASINLSVWDVEIQPVGDVQPLIDTMVAKIEEVFENRTNKQV